MGIFATTSEASFCRNSGDGAGPRHRPAGLYKPGFSGHSSARHSDL